MSANQFQVKYPSGVVTTLTWDAPDVASFINEHFGSAWETAQEHGAEVTMVTGEIHALGVTLDPEASVVHEASGDVAGAGADASGG